MDLETLEDERVRKARASSALVRYIETIKPVTLKRMRARQKRMGMKAVPRDLVPFDITRTIDMAPRWTVTRTGRVYR